MKKLILTLSALVCALCCALGFAACENPADQKVKGSATGNEYIKEVEIFKGTTFNTDTLKLLYSRSGSNSATLEKGALYTVRVLMYKRYGLGDMKMLINDTETALTKNTSSESSSLDCYVCEYTPSADFEIKFRGAAERKAVNVDISYSDIDDWKSRITRPSDIRVRVTVNDANAAAPFESEGIQNSMSLSSFIERITDNDLAVKADDEVDIYIFSTSNDYKVEKGMMDRLSPSELEFKKETFTEEGNKGAHFSFKALTLEISLRLSTHAINLKLA